MLRFGSLSKSYSGTPVLEDLSVEFPATGVHYIAGENGQGKTTLFKCIAGLEQHLGEITWDGGPTSGHIAASFEDSPAHGTLSGLKNLSATLDRPVKAVKSDDRTTRFLGMRDLRKRARAYSFGQRKRLSLTSLFMDEAPCLLLDEPTVGLDASGLQILAAEINKASETKCILLTGHYVDFYSTLANRYYLLSGHHLSDVTEERHSLAEEGM